jgi:two-component system chemotaxis sensor kinase CheA
LLETLILVVAVLGFMAALFASVLTDFEIQQETQRSFGEVGLADRQSTLLARAARDLYELKEQRRSGRAAGETLDSLNAASELIGSTFAAFAQGGSTQDDAGHPVSIAQIKDDNARAIASHAGDLWKPIAAKIGELGKNPSRRQIDAAIDAARPSNEIVELSLQLRNGIVNATNATLDALSTRRLEQLLLSVLCFVLLVFSLFQRVNESQRQVRSFGEDLQARNDELAASARQLTDAKRGTDLIMETTNQGLMLIDAQYRIQPQYSRELETVLQTQALAGQNLLPLLQRVLTERLYLTSRDYLGLLFDVKKKERTVMKVNPLAEVEVSFQDPGGGFINKYLSFSFRRIVADGAVTRVFVAVTDISERIQLETQLRESEEKKNRQFEFLLGILHVDQRLLDEFVLNAREQIQRMNEALRSEDFAVAAGGGHVDQLRQRLDLVFRSVHSIKGNAALMHLSHFQARCEEFESKLAELRGRTTLSGDDFLAVVIAQSDLRTDLDELEELRARFRGLQRGDARPAADAMLPLRAPPAPPRLPAASQPAQSTLAVDRNGADALAARDSTPSDPLLRSLAELLDTLAQRAGKIVRLDVAGFDTTSLDDRRRRVLMDVLSQLARNSVAHGIEAPEARVASGKPRSATISIRPLEASGEDFSFSYRDDGVGLDPDRIRSRAASLGLLSQADAATLDDGGVAVMIFHPGFSTSEEPGQDAGRGMGMSVIKQRIVDEGGGEISVSSVPGRYLEFAFTMPPLPAVQYAAR